jgi:hypothetical protein
MVVKIGDKEVEMVSSALTSLAYKKIFGRDILSTLTNFKADKADLAQANNAIDNVAQLCFVMAMQAKLSIPDFMKLSEVNYYEWVNEFQFGDLFDGNVIENILGVWTKSLGTSVEGKNAKGEAVDR